MFGTQNHCFKSGPYSLDLFLLEVEPEDKLTSSYMLTFLKIKIEYF